MLVGSPISDPPLGDSEEFQPPVFLGGGILAERPTVTVTVTVKPETSIKKTSAYYEDDENQTNDKGIV